MDMSENNEIPVSKTLTPEEQAVWDAKAKVDFGNVIAKNRYLVVYIV